ncbi:hypothetical protein L1987_30832 [Smallanthus sonchifolius]|uniref:Uncharacterized protein n=1 Tax=Smallanthus sonchifolius TaxID=185202 RepID=A0ACB9I5E7_9ASTR|nr:hypothetical protein L1987_30832 [Smallanthus sonchifolius]
MFPDSHTPSGILNEKSFRLLINVPQHFARNSRVHHTWPLTPRPNATTRRPQRYIPTLSRVTFFYNFAMGDAENTFPSKKRAAGRELSRENPGLDDEEECLGQETGTFKSVSDEVLASRRIVKVKHGQTSSTPSAPSSNSFAAIRLVTPANSTPAFVPVNNFQEIEKPDSEKLVVGNDQNTPAVEEEKNGNKDELERNDENTPVSEKENSENNDKLDGNDENNPAPEKENLKNKDKIAGNDESTLAAEKEKYESKEKVEGNDENTPGAKIGNVEKKEILEGNDGNTPAAGSVISFQQLSSNQNAFTGLVGTGFSSSSFSFGSIPSFSFGTNGSSSLFGSTDKKTEGTKTIPSFNKEVQVETGEENEEEVFTTDSVLFEFIDGGWKERGKGELKVNVLTSGTRKARLVMRARGNYRLILNASIFPDMKLTNMEKKGITFACLNGTGEGQNGLSTFALKFKDASVVDEFRSVVMAHKGNLTPPIDLKTPD